MSFVNFILFNQVISLNVGFLYVAFVLFAFLNYLIFRHFSLKKKFKNVSSRYALVNEQLEEAVELSRYKEAEANQANQAKNSFLAVMSHELRTPLNAILGLTGMMDKSPLNEEQKDCLATIKDGGELLLELVTGLLDFSKIESGTMTLEKEAFCPLQIAEDVSRLFRSQAADKKLEIEIVSDCEEECRLWGDPKRCKQILINLVSNAIKFSENSQVIITVGIVDREDDLVSLVFSVKDSGVGIYSQDISRIFEPFEQGDSTNKRLNGGTGLGLAICDRLSHLMNGSIHVESEPNKGSKFTVSISCDRLNSEDYVDEKPTSSEDDSYQLVEEKSFSDCKILLAEDNRVNVKVMSMLFKQVGVQFDVAVNGEEALKLVKHKDYDLVFMDLQMPIMDGLEATKAIRSENLPAQPRIVALTAAVSREDELACYQSGMDDYLTKPIRLEKIATAIAKIRVVTDRINSI